MIAGFYFFQAEDGIRDADVTGVQTCALPISPVPKLPLGGEPGWQSIIASVMPSMTSASTCWVIASIVVTCNATTLSSPLLPATADVCSLIVAVPFGSDTVWFGAPVTATA